MENLTRIELSGKEYPIKCSNYVLEKIQESYGKIGKWERDILGLVTVMDGDKPKRDEKGKIVFMTTEPSVKAINAALPEMIREGMEIEADEKAEKALRLSDKQIIRLIDMDFEKLGEIIHTEFKRCFYSKK